MNNYDFRQLMAARVDDSRSDTHNPWPLSTIPRNRIAYKLYYYLLAMSAYDPTTKLAYISDRKWKKKEAAEKLKCDPRTITNNLKALEEKGLIRRDARKAYVFDCPPFNASVPKQIISLLLNLDGTIDSVLAIRVLSVIQYAVQHKLEKFTITDIKWALRNYDVSGEFIRLCLGWWQSIGLLELESKTEYSGQYGYYTLYTIHQFNWNIATPADGPLTEDFKA